MRLPILLGSILSAVLCACTPSVRSYDIVVVGAGTGGTAAAIQAGRMGIETLLLSETPWVGGMLTEAGVSAVDGNYRLRGGLFGEFRQKLVTHYGSEKALETGWVSRTLFEPSVGDSLLKEMIRETPNVKLRNEIHLQHIERRSEGGYRLTLKSGKGTKETITARIVIDGTELGDIAAKVGVPYDIGMEAGEETHEEIAPKVATGIVQDMTYVAILKDYKHPMPMERPQGYDPSLFACCCLNPLCRTPKEPNRMWSPEKLLSYGKLPNDKYMINWPIEGNDYYANLIDSSERERKEMIEQAKLRTKQFIYFLHKELGFTSLAPADDEYPTEDRLPFYPYYRESRRIRGAVRFDLNHLTHPYDQQQPLYRTAVAVGDYPVDHHHQAYSGEERLPDLHFHPIPSYGVPMGVLLPKDREDLIVAEKSVSVSNLVNGTTRLQPVVMQLGQAAGAAAALSILKDTPPSQLNIREIQSVLLDANGYLLPYLDVSQASPLFAPLQRIGCTGILRGEGRNVLWSNETWMRAEETLRREEIHDLTEYFPQATEEIQRLLAPLVGEVTYEETLQLISALTGKDSKEIYLEWLDDPVTQQAKERDSKISRGAFAYILDKYAAPFSLPMDIHGQLITH